MHLNLHNADVSIKVWTKSPFLGCNRIGFIPNIKVHHSKLWAGGIKLFPTNQTFIKKPIKNRENIAAFYCLFSCFWFDFSVNSFKQSSGLVNALLKKIHYYCFTAVLYADMVFCEISTVTYGKTKINHEY